MYLFIYLFIFFSEYLSESATSPINVDCKTREEVEVNLKHPGRYMFDAAQVLHKIGYFKSACDELTGVIWRTGPFFLRFSGEQSTNMA